VVVAARVWVDVLSGALLQTPVMTRRILSVLLLSSLPVACGGSPTPTVGTGTDTDTTDTDTDQDAVPEEEPPLGKLPTDVRPTSYNLALSIVPDRDRFAGVAIIDIELDRRRDVIWMHGRDLNVTEVGVTTENGEPVAGEWDLVHEEGVVALRLEEPVGPGTAQIRAVYDAPFNRQLTGLYRVDTGGESYAFTQFEATSARRAFPSFDEPRFKVPFDITLTGKADHELAGNTLPVDTQELPEGMKRVRLATTPPLPTYLIAFAVGPLDVVEADPIPANDIRDRPVPFRGLAVKGKGEQLAYALEHTPAQLAWLEEYFDMPYAYDKLDIVAVPDFAAGAMENVGLVTFREPLLLIDPESASEDQKRGFHYVMAHELAHMWFGNIVTMPWWDDIWLNEAFATWMGSKVVEHLNPEMQAPVGRVSRVHYAMGADSLTTARQIRQPIETYHDIRNAFDSITYSKGGGVLEMFERWMGKEDFRRGVQQHMERHRMGTANFEDLLESLDAVTDKPVVEPFRSFLFQPGVPFIDMELTCQDDAAPKLTMKQSRYLPVGSPGDREQTWLVPVCVRYESGGEAKQQCTLLADAEASMELETEACPAWVMPNDDGAGYYRFALSEEGMEALRTRGWDELTDREKLAVSDSVEAAFGNASLPAAQVYGGLDVYAGTDVRQVATMPTDLVSFAHGYLVDEELEPRVERFGQRLYRDHYRRLGWTPRRGRQESGEDKLLREAVIDFLALEVKDPRVRREAERRGRAYVAGGEIHPDAVEPNVAATALAVAVQEGDAEFFDQLTEMLFASDDAVVRGRILSALGHATDEELAARARGLALDARLRLNESTTTLRAQSRMEETREATWQWLTESFDAVKERIGQFRTGFLPWMGAGFCSEERAEQLQAFFAPKIEDLPGGPRNLAGALEAIRLCAAKVEAHQESAREFFANAR